MAPADVCTYVNKVANEVRGRLADGKVPSPGQLSNYVTKVVGEMQKLVTDAPRHIQDKMAAPWQGHYDFWRNDSHTPLDVQKLLAILEKLEEAFPLNQGAAAEAPTPTKGKGAPAASAPAVAAPSKGTAAKGAATGKGWGGKAEPERPAAPPAPAPSVALTRHAGAAPSSSSTAPKSEPRRFGADDYEAAEEADLEGEMHIFQEEREDLLRLQIPPLSTGQQGKPLKLVANHFHLELKSDKRDSTIWCCWRVDFRRAETVRSQGSLTKGQAPKAKGQDDNEVSKAVRKAAVEIHLADIPTYDWLHDGNNMLYIRKTVTKVSDCRTEVEVPGKTSRSKPFRVAIEVKREDREIDLSALHKPPVDFKDASEAMGAMSEHRRFVQVAIRTLALEREALIAQGRKVVCPDARLVCDAIPLRYGREMWFGYIGQLEVVNGGLLPNGRFAPARTALSLNLVASVGIPEQTFIQLLGRLRARAPGNKADEDWYAQDLTRNYWERKVTVEYGTVKIKGKRIFGTTDRPANKVTFDCEEMGGKTNVVDYFMHKHNVRVKYPNLPCIQLGTAHNCIPFEFVHVLGGEHNLEVGKLKAEFQQEVTRKTAMPPSQRRDQIMRAHQNKDLGPSAALEGKGIKVGMEMARLTGRLLDKPFLKDGKFARVCVNYSNSFTSIAPPQYEISWGLWCFASNTSQRDVDWFAKEFVNKCRDKGLRFSQPKFVQWPEQAYNAFYEGNRRRETFDPKLGEALRSDLWTVAQQYKDLKLLVVLLDDSESMTDHLYKLTKLITETEMDHFVTQFINSKKGIADAEKKLNNVILKVAPKLPLTVTTCRAAHNVVLADPHRLLQKEEATMIMGADVCHKVAGISVAAVVASQDTNFASYFHEIRGQSPYTLNELKVRSRQSEERIVDLAGMTHNLLQRWRRMNNDLPKTILYYRDGVSDGQFVNVLTRELNLLSEGFKRVSAKYDPQLIIIVGQKRHHHRFWMEEGGKGGSGKGKDDKGKGKGKGKDAAQVPAGTVAGESIAQPSHLNFFLVSQEGIQGTSVPCHYHVLHMDKRLVQKGIKVDDLETITFQLCHMYSRADKSVGYATPAYMADHACERGRHYLEAHFGFGASDILSNLGSSVSEEKQEKHLKELIEERTNWLNQCAQKCADKKLNGLQLYC
ncbi:unnamed protein product [Durusdinium trenchii]|uniref:Uncharacterized protein n=1 Tax=Durusdinium trenchii TaxID=1381693 RepID=A0ABP0LQZ0_9DINO